MRSIKSSIIHATGAVAIVFAVAGPSVPGYKIASPLIQPERINVKDHTHIVMADLSPASKTPSAPKLPASPAYRIAQPQACLGQGHGVMKHANAAMVYAVGQIIDTTLVSSGCVASETLRHNAYRPKPPGRRPVLNCW